MVKNTHAFDINNPVFVRTKKKFNWSRFSYDQNVKAVYINERIVELPFVIQGLALLPRNARILDVGCSESILPMQMAGLGYAVTGLDFRQYSFSFPGLQFCQSDATKMPLEEDSFDAVTCVSMLEHVGIGHYNDPLHQESGDARVVAEIARVLRKNGLFFLTVPFGVPTVGGVQRTYDAARLAGILGNFKVEEQKYFMSVRNPDCLNNHWQVCPQDRAQAVSSVDKTACVCLIRARKS
ncbi:MAG: class I SAM-dependent methyltransferase [Candidatus Omnitrophota bacterium]